MKQAAQLVNNTHMNIQGKELALNHGGAPGLASQLLGNGNPLPGSSGVRIKTEPPEKGVRIKQEPVDKDKPVPMETGEVQTVASNSHSSHISNGPHASTDSSSELQEAVRTFLREKFQSNCVLNITELRKMLLFRVSECAADDVLNLGVSDRLMEECAIQVGATALPIPVSIIIIMMTIFSYSSCARNFENLFVRQPCIAEARRQPEPN